MSMGAGTSIVSGIAIGPLHFYTRPARRYDLTPCPDPDAELARMEQARQVAILQQDGFYEKALTEADADIAVVFQVHAMMLDDDEFVQTIRRNILEHRMRAEYAVRCAAYAMTDRFSQVEDEYLRSRVDDIMDMARGVIYLLQGGVEQDVWTQPSILVAEDLSPSETVQLNKDLLLGFVTKMGSSISHTAILARSMNLPALVGCKSVDPSWEGHTAILDGIEGQLILDPDEETVKKYTYIQAEILHRRKLLRQLKGLPSITEDGRAASILASIMRMEDLEHVKENDAEGIGQFRSESLFWGRADAPSEEEQYDAYRQMLRAAAPGPVVVSTCNLGSEKPVTYLNFNREANPALGLRGIRRSLKNPEFFKVQLRAALRAAAKGDMRIMLPMVARLNEVHAVRALLDECRTELTAEGKVWGDLKLGIIVETPAAVWIADELAALVDFMSVGTNDLTQYICALDREDPNLDGEADLHHPAVLRAIRHTVQAGHRHGIPVGICGELAADLSMTETFLRMGVDDFSVRPNAVLPLRLTIRDLNLSEAASDTPVHYIAGAVHQMV